MDKSFKIYADELKVGCRLGSSSKSITRLKTACFTKLVILLVIVIIMYTCQIDHSKKKVCEFFKYFCTFF